MFLCHAELLNNHSLLSRRKQGTG